MILQVLNILALKDKVICFQFREVTLSKFHLGEKNAVNRFPKDQKIIQILLKHKIHNSVCTVLRRNRTTHNIVIYQFNITNSIHRHSVDINFSVTEPIKLFL